MKKYERQIVREDWNFGRAGAGYHHASNCIVQTPLNLVKHPSYHHDLHFEITFDEN